MLNAIIVDDEYKSRETLKELITNFCLDVKVVGTAESVSEGLHLIKTLTPDVLFLDIEMNVETGFDLLEKIEVLNFEVIFVTAYEQYALKAIKMAAIDYLLKPVVIEELKSALKKVKEKRLLNSHNQNFKVFLSNIRTNAFNQQKISLPTSSGYIFVDIAEIMCCEADGSYTHIFLSNGSKITVSQPIKEYEELLSESGFLRIHHSSLINLSKVKSYVKGEGGYVIMQDKREVRVSRSKKAELLKILLNQK